MILAELFTLSQENLQDRYLNISPDFSLRMSADAETTPKELTAECTISSASVKRASQPPIIELPAEEEQEEEVEVEVEEVKDDIEFDTMEPLKIPLNHPQTDEVELFCRLINKGNEQKECLLEALLLFQLCYVYDSIATQVKDLDNLSKFR